MVRYLRELYTLKIPYTSLILLGAIPNPGLPAAVVLDEVTNGKFQNQHQAMNLALLHIILTFQIFVLGVNILHYQ
jgi:hypothetical protein